MEIDTQQVRPVSNERDTMSYGDALLTNDKDSLLRSIADQKSKMSAVGNEDRVYQEYAENLEKVFKDVVLYSSDVRDVLFNVRTKNGTFVSGKYNPHNQEIEMLGRAVPHDKAQQYAEYVAEYCSPLGKVVEVAQNTQGEIIACVTNNGSVFYVTFDPKVKDSISLGNLTLSRENAAKLIKAMSADAKGQETFITSSTSEFAVQASKDLKTGAAKITLYKIDENGNLTVRQLKNPDVHLTMAGRNGQINASGTTAAGKAISFAAPAFEPVYANMPNGKEVSMKRF